MSSVTISYLAYLMLAKAAEAIQNLQHHVNIVRCQPELQLAGLGEVEGAEQ